MNKKIDKYEGSNNFEELDRFKAPILNFDKTKEYEELSNKEFRTAEGEKIVIKNAMQTLKLSIDENGGEIKSELNLLAKASASIDEKDEGRYFYVDDTFVIFLREKGKDKPYFAYIHLDDCHRQEFFYTYDTNDFNKLDEEFKAIENYMHKLPKNYRGNLSYDVSLQYADICLRRLYTFLAEHKMLDNLNIFICADHGSSYTFDPYRKNYVNNEHRENYNMPFVIWSKDLKPEVINGMYNTKDIPATMLAMNNLSIPKTYDGMSILNNKPRDYVLLENVCGGCPDYNLRDFMLGIRNNNYVIVMNVNAHKEFSDGEILAIYDLKTDRQEKYNLKDTLDRSVIEKELKILKNEFEILKEDIKKHNFIDV